MNQLKSFARECVLHYATYNKIDGFYNLEVKDLPGFIKNEFASLLISNDNIKAAEATGPDNKDWEIKMLPTLINYLQHSTKKDEEIEFKNAWRDCVTRYFYPQMQEIINDYLQEYNDDARYSAKNWSDYYGVTHLFGA